MKNNKGITLIALAITIIVLIIIASVGTYTGSQAIKDSKEQTLLAEIGILQQAVLENYTKYITTGNDMYILGKDKDRKSLTFAEMQTLVNSINSKITDGAAITLKSNNYDLEDKFGIESYYYELSEKDLKEMDVSTSKDTVFIVNFATGEVINKTDQVTKSGKPIYVYAQNIEET